jgi:LacI family transcriptional regulator
VDGLLLAGGYPRELVDRVYTNLKRPIVLVDNTIPGLPYDVVMADDFGGGYLATQHLISLGHSRISAVLGQPQVPSLTERYRGYCAACRAAGLEPSPPIMISWDIRTARRELAQLLPNLALPHALFCAIDLYAIAALDLFHEIGMAVPERVSVVGFDDLDPARRRYSNLTTIHNQPLIQGELAVERLLARIDGDTRPRQQIHVGVQLVVRETTAPPPSSKF